MRNDIQLKQQAQMLKAAWEEGWKNADQVSVDGLDFSILWSSNGLSPPPNKCTTSF